MQTLVYPNYETLSLETALLIARQVQAKPDSLLCFPAGETSLGTFTELIRMQKEGTILFNKCKIVGLDEWVQLGEMASENCFHFLKKHLFDPLGIKDENMHFFDGEADDLENECRLTDQFIRTNGRIDLMLLGLGMNGHLGLNEPGSSFDSTTRIVELDAMTNTIGQKYFTAQTKLTKGITLGLRQVMETRTVILQVSGNKKASITGKLIESEITNSLPATLLKEHPGALLLLDRAAVSNS